MEIDYIRNRITQLRIQKGVSEYAMSLSLGHSRSYIQSISSGKMLPSVKELLYICEYLGVTPKEFFDDGTTEPALVQKVFEGVRDLDDKDILLLLSLIERLKEEK